MPAIASPVAPAANAGNVLPPAGTVPGEVVTGAAAPVEAPIKPKAKRGRAAAGMSVFPVADKETGAKLAKEKGERFTVFTVTDPAKPGDAPDAPRRVRFFVSNHRNAVQHQIFTADGYHIISGTGENKGGRVVDPATKAKKADALLESMDDAARLALFAKYAAGNPALAAALAGPASGPRNDTTPEFAAAGNGAAPVAQVPPNRTAPAPAVGNQPTAQASGAGKGNTGGGGKKR